MHIEESITRLIGLAKVGEVAAVEQLWGVYFGRLVAVARDKLALASRRVADEEDVALSAFHSFWSGVRGDRFPHLTDRSSLWPLLVAITRNKCIDHVRRQSRLKRGGPTEPLCGLDTALGHEPGPDDAAAVVDQLAHLLTALDRTGDDALRRVAELRLGGHTTTEIASALECSVRTVERKLSLVERCWVEEVCGATDY